VVRQAGGFVAASGCMAFLGIVFATRKTFNSSVNM
jgi:hypothetical protein